jgi:hypothetical protein
MVKKEYIKRDMPAVRRVRMTSQACGRKDPVVQQAAIKPRVSALIIIRLFMCAANKMPTVISRALCAEGQNDANGKGRYKRIAVLHLGRRR